MMIVLELSMPHSDPLLRGIWPAVLIETRDGAIDFEVLAATVRHFADAGVHGLYTGDTASEFYTMEYEEWNDLATAFRVLCAAAGVPAGVGCTWTNQVGALRRVARAVELGYHNIHLSQPYWLSMNDAARKEFWSAVGEQAGGALRIVVYSGSQVQLPLNGNVIMRLREYCPAIAGTKSTGFDGLALNSLLAQCPELSHFVGESVLTQWVALGAAGVPSSLAGLSARFMVHWWGVMERGEWSAAFEIQRRVNRFYEESVVPLRNQGFIVDKTLAEIGGIPGITRRLRAPYPSPSNDQVARLEAVARQYLPECFAS